VDPDGSAGASRVWLFVGGEDVPVVLVRELDPIQIPKRLVVVTAHAELPLVPGELVRELMIRQICWPHDQLEWL
jgi:hypothetical protein